MSAFRIATQDVSHGTRNKPRDPRKVSERSIQYALVDRLRLMAPPDVLFLAIPNGELRDLAILNGEKRVAAGKLRAMGVRNGASDLLIIKAGRALFLELKRQGQKPRPDQLEFQTAAESAGAEYAYCDTLDGAVALLVERGILPPDRRVR